MRRKNEDTPEGYYTYYILFVIIIWIKSLGHIGTGRQRAG
jgi:hypothetical protein